MEIHQDLYKKNSVKDIFHKREESWRNRKEQRSLAFDLNRQAAFEDECNDIDLKPPTPITKHILRKRPKKPNAQRKAKEILPSQKRPFVVGVVRHRIHSPPFLHGPLSYEDSKNQELPKSFAPKTYQFQFRCLKKIHKSPIKEIEGSPFTLRNFLSQKVFSPKILANSNITVRSRNHPPTNSGHLHDIGNHVKKGFDRKSCGATKKELFSDDSYDADEPPIFGKQILSPDIEKKENYCQDDCEKENIAPNSGQKRKSYIHSRYKKNDERKNLSRIDTISSDRKKKIRNNSIDKVDFESCSTASIANNQSWTKGLQSLHNTELEKCKGDDYNCKIVSCFYSDENPSSFDANYPDDFIEDETAPSIFFNTVLLNNTKIDSGVTELILQTNDKESEEKVISSVINEAVQHDFFNSLLQQQKDISNRRRTFIINTGEYADNSSSDDNTKLKNVFEEITRDESSESPRMLNSRIQDIPDLLVSNKLLSPIAECLDKNNERVSSHSTPATDSSNEFYDSLNSTKIVESSTSEEGNNSRILQKSFICDQNSSSVNLSQNHSSDGLKEEINNKSLKESVNGNAVSKIFYEETAKDSPNRSSCSAEHVKSEADKPNSISNDLYTTIENSNSEHTIHTEIIEKSFIDDQYNSSVNLSQNHTNNGIEVEIRNESFIASRNNNSLSKTFDGETAKHSLNRLSCMAKNIEPEKDKPNSSHLLTTESGDSECTSSTEITEKSFVNDPHSYSVNLSQNQTNDDIEEEISNESLKAPPYENLLSKTFNGESAKDSPNHLSCIAENVETEEDKPNLLHLSTESGDSERTSSTEMTEKSFNNNRHHSSVNLSQNQTNDDIEEEISNESFIASRNNNSLSKTFDGESAKDSPNHSRCIAENIETEEDKPNLLHLSTTESGDSERTSSTEMTEKSFNNDPHHSSINLSQNQTNDDIEEEISNESLKAPPYENLLSKTFNGESAKDSPNRSSCMAKNIEPEKDKPSSSHLLTTESGDSECTSSTEITEKSFINDPRRSSVNLNQNHTNDNIEEETSNESFKEFPNENSLSKTLDREMAKDSPNRSSSMAENIEQKIDKMIQSLTEPQLTGNNSTESISLGNEKKLPSQVNNSGSLKELKNVEKTERFSESIIDSPVHGKSTTKSILSTTEAINNKSNCFDENESVILENSIKQEETTTQVLSEMCTPVKNVEIIELSDSPMSQGRTKKGSTLSKILLNKNLMKVCSTTEKVIMAPAIVIDKDDETRSEIRFDKINLKKSIAAQSVQRNLNDTVDLVSDEEDEQTDHMTFLSRVLVSRGLSKFGSPKAASSRTPLESNLATQAHSNNSLRSKYAMINSPVKTPEQSPARIFNLRNRNVSATPSPQKTPKKSIETSSRSASTPLNAIENLPKKDIAKKLVASPTLKVENETTPEKKSDLILTVASPKSSRISSIENKITNIHSPAGITDKSPARILNLRSRNVNVTPSPKKTPMKSVSTPSKSSLIQSNTTENVPKNNVAKKLIPSPKLKIENEISPGKKIGLKVYVVSPKSPSIKSIKNKITNTDSPNEISENSPARVLNLRNRNVSVTPSPKKTPMKSMEKPSKYVLTPSNTIENVPRNNIAKKLIASPRLKLEKQTTPGKKKVLKLTIASPKSPRINSLEESPLKNTESPVRVLSLRSRNVSVSPSPNKRTPRR